MLIKHKVKATNHRQIDAEIHGLSLSVTILMLHDLQSPELLLFWQQSICFRPAPSLGVFKSVLEDLIELSRGHKH